MKYSRNLLISPQLSINVSINVKLLCGYKNDVIDIKALKGFCIET